jgi:hypothetical protein
MKGRKKAVGPSVDLYSLCPKTRRKRTVSYVEKIDCFTKSSGKILLCIGKIVVRSASTFMEQLKSMKRRQIGDVIKFLVV